MAYGVITLGREICSGGCDIAKEAARELGLPYYDKELITIAAKKSGLSEEDYIAFPYGKTVVEGADTKESSSSDYYNS